jgi:SAM-dependent methyltransferase
MKYRLLSVLRSLHLLTLADELKYWSTRAQVASSNRAFRRKSPDFPVPAYELAFDAYNNLSFDDYRDVGRLHASVFAEIIQQVYGQAPISVLDWGCGPGRVIRHLPKLLGPAAKLTGIDNNPKSIAWCRAQLAGIEFSVCQLMPPTHFADDQFDVICSFSVLTHLSRDAVIAWIAELGRILKPGGLIICTTHGDNYRHLLSGPEEVGRYEAGDLVVQGNYAEGKKWFLAIHPEPFMRNVLSRLLVDVQRILLDPSKQMKQDVWIGRKPARPAPEGGVSLSA